MNVDKGDVFYIPAGRIHTIGKGIMLAEIQQTSDITYRIYDFDRVDSAGNKRELHTADAVDALDFTFYESYKTRYAHSKNDRVSLVSSPYFTTNKFNIDQPQVLNYDDLDSFVIYIFTAGEGTLKYNDGEQDFKMGEVFLIPAAISAVEIIPNGDVEFLEIAP
ncbi:MAG: AraC family ligand binding domain-containing protein [Fulvivirga sp.]